MRSTLQTIGIAVGILVLLILGLTVLSQTGRAQPFRQGSEGDSSMRNVSVSGVGRVSAQPNQAVVRVGVQTEAESAAQALLENNTRMQALLEALQSAGIPSEDIQTQTLQLFPRFDQPAQGGEPRLDGYTARNLVEARLSELEGLGEVLDAAIQAGGNTIESIHFELEEPDVAYDQARAAAIQDAQRKAEQLASLAEAELGQVWSITETTRTLPPILPEPAAREQGAVPIEPGAQSIEVEVQVTWLLR